LAPAERHRFAGAIVRSERAHSDHPAIERSSDVCDLDHSYDDFIFVIMQPKAWLAAAGRKQQPFGYGSISGRQDFYFIAGK
jgi:hypothetical protein